jgi:hypothetical protein
METWAASERHEGIRAERRADMRRLASWVIVGLTLTSCSTSPPAADPTRMRSAAATPSVQTSTPTPTGSAPARPRRIDVGALPDEGVAVDLGREVLLLDLDGRVLDRMPGYSLYFQWTVPGEVVVRQGETFFVLRVERGVFGPLPGEDAAFDLDPQFQSHVGLPRPAGAVAGVGRWTYALPGPNDLVLAQWSGECEVPNAMFVLPGQVPLAVTGGRSLRAPESVALGWDDRGRAIVDLREGVCGTSFERPGIYAFTGPGAGELIFRDPDLDGARMWGAPA